jgi:hypothetical protein
VDHIANYRNVGNVYRIIDFAGSPGYVGALITATEIKSWGIQGVIHHVLSRDESAQIPLRVEWANLSYIGETYEPNS